MLPLSHDKWNLVDFSLMLCTRADEGEGQQSSKNQKWWQAQIFSRLGLPF